MSLNTGSFSIPKAHKARSLQGADSLPILNSGQGQLRTFGSEKLSPDILMPARLSSARRREGTALCLQ